MMKNMSTIPDKILELMVLQLNHEQTPDEEKELAAWLAADEKHQSLWNGYLEVHQQMRMMDQPFESDIETALRQAKMPRRSLPVWKNVITWAAIFILPLCVGLWLLVTSGPDEENRLFSQVAHPGSEKAILKIADKCPIHLDGGMDTLIVTESGVRIKTDSANMLSYEIDSAVGNDSREDNELIVPRGGEYRITLSDGTRVWLNSASKLTFPQGFSGSERRVRLSGEAFFEVAPDTAHPFVVITAQMDIKVLGTSFNVSVYEDEPAVHTTLVKGRVEVLTAGHDPLVLKPGEQAQLSGESLVCREVNTRQFTSWIDGKFMFNNTGLEEISKQISRWYDVDIFFSSERVKTVCFTGAILRFEPLDELIRMIEKTSNVRFNVKGKTIVISEQ